MTINRIVASDENQIIADMAHTHTLFRTWAALFLLGVLVIVFASLGNWQLNRAAQRDEIRQRIAAASVHSNLTLTPATEKTELIAWRKASAQGHWLHRYTVLLENRNHHGLPGYWVATPLLLDSTQDISTATPETAVLVLRGWLPRTDVMVQSQGLPRLATDLGHRLAQPEGMQIITGELFDHVPRAFELWSRSDHNATQLPAALTDTRQQLPTLQNLALPDYARATGLVLLPTVLAESSPDLSMVQDWPYPSLDADTNRGYALQWFAFCAIAAGAWLLIAWRLCRKSRNVS